MSAREGASEPLVDAAARAAIRDDHGVSMVVEAAAGTGKTTMLVERLVSLVGADRASLRGVVAVTFTERAAGGLALRLRWALDAARRAAVEDARHVVAQRFERALEELELASIGTLHGFCADLLRERPLEAGIDPAFRVLSEDDARALLARATSSMFPALLDPPGEGLRRLLARAAGRGEDVRVALDDAVRTLVEHRDHPAPWPRAPFDRRASLEAMQASLVSLAAFVPLAMRASDGCVRSLEPVAAWAAEQASGARHAAPDLDVQEASLVRLAQARTWGWNGHGKFFAKEILRADVVARRDAVKSDLDAFCARADADLAVCLQRELAPVVARYEDLKRQRGALDFLDLLLAARRMLVTHEGARRALQDRYTHLFIDEFQDTDPVQADLVRLLAADDPSVSDPERTRPVPGKLFVVGDPKQSVYRFRRADLATYHRVRDALVASGAVRLELRTSFRSLPEIQGVLNAAFGRVMDGRDGQAAHVPLAPHRRAEPGRPAVVALGIPRPYEGAATFSKAAIEASTPAAVAGFVAWLVRQSGWMVRDPATGLQTPVAPEHVCLLFRRTRQAWNDADVVRPYTRALEAHGVRHAWLSGRGFHTRPEVEALRCVAEAVDDPDDAVAVYAVLRGPFLALTDAELLRFRDRMGTLHPMRHVERAGLEPDLDAVAEGLALLRALHVARNVRPAAETLRRFLDATRGHVSLAMRRGGEEALAAALQMVARARRSDASGQASFRAFVETLRAEAEGSGGSAEDAGADDGPRGVKVMTVHRAKGLEFPVVVLCDPTATSVGHADRLVEHAAGRAFVPLARAMPAELRAHAASSAGENQAELVRLTYVAASRARDLLVVPACGDAPFEGGWLSVLNAALYPPREAWRHGEGRAPGCPEFGDESVRHRSFDAEQAGASSVRPGLHRELGVVWWDPNVLTLEADRPEGLRAEELLRRGNGDEAARAAKGHAALQAWAAGRAAQRADGALPTVPWEPLQAEARRRGAAGGRVHVERVSGPPRRGPSGPRSQALFRASLAVFEPTDASGETSRLVSGLGRSFAASADEVAAVAEALGALAAHPWWAESRASERGVPCAFLDARGVVVEGTIDLVRDRPESRLAAMVVWTDEAPTEADRAAALASADALSEVRGVPHDAAVIAV